MTLQHLENLAKIDKLKAEPPTQPELDGLRTSGARRLVDARNSTLSLESRFDLPYNASHAFALAALRFRGYRSDSRYLVFHASNTRSGSSARSGVSSTRPTAIAIAPSMKVTSTSS